MINMEFDDVFHDLDRALVYKQEVCCYRQQKNGKIRWVIEIDDPKTAEAFEARISSFFHKLKKKIEV